MALSKKEMNRQALAQQMHRFACPVCRQGMTLKDEARFVCHQAHSFDLSKQGYIHLAPQAQGTKYDRTLFEARNNMMKNGFFNPLLDKISQVIQRIPQANGPLAISDAGCGEGSHLAYLTQQLSTIGLTGVGIDLSKEGIQQAARDYPGHGWVVGDLANSPFQSHVFDAVLNILSPANYAEFKRLLTPQGRLIKIVPEVQYLRQLREVFQGKEEGVARDAVGQVAGHFSQVEDERLTYDFPMSPLLLESLVRMTPLTWHASRAELEDILTRDIPFMTVDLRLIVASNETF